MEGYGADPPPASCTQKPDDASIRGGYLDTHHNWVTFSPKRRHCIEPILNGTRYSIVLFTPGRTGALKPSHLAELHTLGFQVPGGATSSHSGVYLQELEDVEDTTFPFDPGVMD